MQLLAANAQLHFHHQLQLLIRVLIQSQHQQHGNEMAGTPPDTEQPESVTATPPDTEQEPAPVTSPDTESKPGGRQLQWRDVPIEPSEWKAEHA